jgi:hypothetical protein
VYRHRDDGTREINVFAEPGVIRFRATAPTVQLAHVDGTVEVFHPADPVRAWLPLAFSDDAVANVFRILSSGALDWVNLYRIFEIVAASAGGVDTIASNGWAAKDSMSLFKHTANSPRAVGLESRHGASSNQPPARPMTISEARSLIVSIVHAWLRAKSGAP